MTVMNMQAFRERGARSDAWQPLAHYPSQQPREDYVWSKHLPRWERQVCDLKQAHTPKAYQCCRGDIKRAKSVASEATEIPPLGFGSGLEWGAGLSSHFTHLRINSLWDPDKPLISHFWTNES